MATIVQTKKLIKVGFKIKQPLFLWGPPGVGKSHAVAQVANEEKVNILDIRAALTEQGDWAGLPYTAKDISGAEYMKFHITPLLPQDPNWKGIIFLDELNRAPREVLNCIFQLIYDRKIQNYYNLPKEAYIVSAGNPPDEDEPSSEMGRAFLSRFTHIQVNPSVTEFVTYGKESGISSNVLSFVKKNPNMFSSVESEFKFSSLKPNPRSWEKVSVFHKALQDSQLVEELGTEVITGIVGSTAAIQYFEHCNKPFDKIDPKIVIMDYKKEQKKVLQFVEEGKIPEQKEALEAILTSSELIDLLVSDSKKVENFLSFLKDCSSDVAFTGLERIMKEDTKLNDLVYEIIFSIVEKKEHADLNSFMALRNKIIADEVTLKKAGVIGE